MVIVVDIEMDNQTKANWKLSNRPKNLGGGNHAGAIIMHVQCMHDTNDYFASVCIR